MSSIKERPRIEIDKEVRDHIVIGIGWIAWIALALLPIYYYAELPSEIPSHFGIDGQADDWDGKGVIWLLPSIGSLMFFGLMVLRRFPHLYNYPIEITNENAKKQYTTAIRMLSLINTLITLTFAYITFATIQISFGNMTGLGVWSLVVFLILIFGSTAYFLYKLLAVK